MKLKAALQFLSATAIVAGAAYGPSVLAQPVTQDDLKWVNQCVADNKGLTTPEIARKYCICMNEKMDDNETRSISQWEKANPKARAQCDKISGWK
jgi:hypothetical protein